MLRARLLFISLVAATVIILIFEIFEIVVYSFADKSDLLSDLYNSAYIFMIHKSMTLISLPLFSFIAAFGFKDIEDSDRNLIVISAVFYIFTRIILLELIIPFDFYDIETTNYFNSNFYVHCVLISLSYIVIFGVLYYVLVNKRNFPRHGMIFVGMIIVNQFLLLMYQIILVYLFNNNIEVKGLFYKEIMLLPTVAIQVVSACMAFLYQKDRDRIYDILRD